MKVFGIKMGNGMNCTKNIIYEDYSSILFIVAANTVEEAQKLVKEKSICNGPFGYTELEEHEEINVISDVANPTIITHFMN